MHGKSKNIIFILTLSILFSLTFELVFPTRIFSKKNSVEAEGSATEQNKNNSVPEKLSGKIPVYFEENRGQFDRRVKYFTRGTSGYALFLTGTEAVYVLREHEPKSRVQKPHSEPEDLGERTPDTRAVAVYMRLAGANENPETVGFEQMPHRTNYFKGEEANWRTEIPNYREVRFKNVYPGIDAVWKGKADSDLQYDFAVKPFADPAQIEWEIEGADAVEIDERGNLLIKTELGEIRQQKPFTYQQDINGFKQEVESRFKIVAPKNSERLTTNKYRVKFALGGYDPSKTLTIDPTVNLSNMAFSTFLGGGTNEVGSAIAVDRDGNVYVTGRTSSVPFPTTPGTFDTTFNGFIDAFVAKLDPTGSTLLYSTYLGGNEWDVSSDIAVDTSGNVFITGTTDGDGEIDYPTTDGAYDTTQNGNLDAFVTKLNPTGSTLLYSTFVGGVSLEDGNGIKIDSLGNAHITGRTWSEDFPTTILTFDRTHNGKSDAFVTKLNATGSGIFYSTFIGGKEEDSGNDLALDAFRNAYITGRTESFDFPTSAGAFDRQYAGFEDVFVVKLNSDGMELVYSTYIGGNSEDRGLGIAIDSSGNAFVTGWSYSNGFPSSPGSYDRTHNGGADVFVTKLNSIGTGIFYSTFLGGNSNDWARDILLDADGNAYVTGTTRDAIPDDFPTTPGAYDTTHNMSWDAFVAKLNPTGSALEYSTFIGGKRGDHGFGIALDSAGNLYITGKTDANPIVADNYPTTSGAFSTLHSGNEDAFVSKFGATSILPGNTDFDFDGDGRTDIGVWRPGPGEWWYLRSGDGGNSAFQFGSSSDTIVPTDFTGDGKTDVAFWRNGEWFVLRSEDFSFFAFPFGTTGDIPVPGDFDGDNRSDPAVFRPSNATWYYIRSSDGLVSAVQFGLGGDVPIVKDYDGDGTDDLAVYRPDASEWFLQRSTDGFIGFSFGSPGNTTPVPADFTGDGKADIAFFQTSTNRWFVLRSEDSSFFAFPFGTTGDIPVPGDYDGDGRADPAVFRPSSNTWFLQQTTDRFEAVQFGVAGDVPIPAAYIP